MQRETVCGVRNYLFILFNSMITCNVETIQFIKLLFLNNGFKELVFHEGN